MYLQDTNYVIILVVAIGKITKRVTLKNVLYQTQFPVGT